MKILVVCQYYYPEPFRIHEVCAELVNRGHEVTVLTGLPNYPMGIIPDEYKGRQHRDEVMDGVHVVRVTEIPRKRGKIGLAKNYVSFVFFGSLKALTMKKDFDAIFVYQLSPVLMAIPAYVAKWFSKCKKLCIYCLDLWPESLSSLGISHDSGFYGFMKRVSVRIYKGAGSIGYTSRMFEKYFREYLGIGDKRFVHIPQFADEIFSHMEEDSDETENTDVNGILDNTKNSDNSRYINFVFAGNVGEMQSVDTIIKAAALVRNERIRWYIVGDGFALESCKKLCDDMGLNEKVIFVGRRPVEEMPKFYKMADAMIVTLADNETISYTLPGKIQSYMAAGKPILAAANGETAHVINEAGCGLCAPSEDAEAFAKIADEMAGSDFERYKTASERYYDEHFTKKLHVDLIEEMLEKD